jgi:2'-5' RNA ligase
MRLFIGVKTGCEDYLTAIQQELHTLGKGNFTDRDNLHMTLKFLGDVSPVKVKLICEAITQVQTGAIALCCEGLQAFGRDIISAKVGGERDKLSALYKSLESALEKCGFEAEQRPYKPHITLVRQFRPFGAFDLGAIPAARKEFQVNDVILFESTREQGKLVYKPLFEHRLSL